MNILIVMRPTFKYDQKAVLLRTVRHYIKKTGATSLLDIGAGDGTLAIPLSKSVKTYIAVENNKNNVKKLREANLRVISGKFPVSIKTTFDMVLISHSLPETIGNYKKFLNEAWRKVRNDGLLLIITFKGSNSKLEWLRKKVIGKTNLEDEKKYNTMINIIKKFGVIKTTYVTSKIRSDKEGVMLDILCDSLGVSNKEDKYRDDIRKIIRRYFKDSHGFIFPTKHIVLTVKK